MRFLIFPLGKLSPACLLLEKERLPKTTSIVYSGNDYLIVVSFHSHTHTQNVIANDVCDNYGVLRDKRDFFMKNC